MAVTSPHTLNHGGVRSEVNRISKAHGRHFLALSVFFLPLSFSLVVNPTLRSFKSSQNHQQTLIFNLLYILFVYLISICALATITYSTFQGFHRRPVKFLNTIKSLRFSFFPLISTLIAAQFFLFLISLSFLLFLILIVKLGQNLGFLIDYNSIYFISFCFAALIPVMIYFQVNWALAPAIVVAESKWGFEPLRRSSYLVKGMRSVSLSLLLYFAFFVGLCMWIYSTIMWNQRWRSNLFVFHSIGGSSFLLMFLLRTTMDYTVLYMYCKALHGELVIEIAESEEFARKCDSLPFDDEEVPHVVTVVSA